MRSLGPTGVNSVGWMEPPNTVDYPKTLPDRNIDLLEEIGPWPVRDQGDTAMCTAFAVAACVELKEALKSTNAPGKVTPQAVSASFLYYATRREIEKELEKAKPGAATVPATTILSDLPFAIHLPEHPDSGANFSCVAAAVRAGGLRDAAGWPDSRDEAPRDGQRGRGVEKMMLMPPVDHPPGKEVMGVNGPAVMRRLCDVILDQLGNRRPVAVAFPFYRNAGGGLIWDDAAARDGTLDFARHPYIASDDGGHAVCIVGFERDTSDSGSTWGGWFVFRNSAGVRFGQERVPFGTNWGPGYGRVALSDMMHCWDYLSMDEYDDVLAKGP